MKSANPIRHPYRGSGRDRPLAVPLPPEPMPMLQHGRLLKRWRYVSVWSPELSLCAGSVTVGLVRQEFWAVWDRGRGVMHENTRLLATGRVRLPPRWVLVRDGDVRIDVELDEREGESFEVLTPVGSAYTWTRKQVVRAQGTVRLGSERLRVEVVALIDDNAGYHPRHTLWRWSGGAGVDTGGRAVAWSVIVGLNDSPQESERSLWVEGESAREVGPVEIADDLSRVVFADGGQVRFTQEAVRARRDNLLLLRSSYRQPFGSFKGTLPGGIELREGYGVMEFHEAWW